MKLHYIQKFQIVASRSNISRYFNCATFLCNGQAKGKHTVVLTIYSQTCLQLHRRPRHQKVAGGSESFVRTKDERCRTLGHEDCRGNRGRRRHTARWEVLCRSRGRPVRKLDSLWHCAESSMESVRETAKSLGGAGRGGSWRWLRATATRRGKRLAADRSFNMSCKHD